MAKTMSEGVGLSRKAVTMVAGWRQAVGSHLARYWAPWVALLVIAFALAIGLETGFDRLAHRWRFAYNHSLLLFPMSAWLLAVALRQGRVTRLAPSIIGMLGLVGAVAFYGLAELLDFTLGMQVGVLLVFAATLVALLGMQFAWHATGAFALLTFTVPVWDLFNGLLQDISTWVVSSWVRATGLVAHIDAYYITIPSGTFEIAEGCSGLRYTVIALALAVFYSFCWLQSWKSRLALIAVAAVASMIGNWVRIYTLILIGHWTQMEHYLIAVSHDEHGWVVFFLAMAPVLWFARRLERRDARRPGTSAATGGAGVQRMASAPAFLLTGAVIATMVAAPLALRGGAEAPTAPGSVVLVDTPQAGWSAAEPSSRWAPDFARPHLEAHEAFVSDEGLKVDAFMARYLSQQEESKLIASRHSMNPGWRARATETVTVAVNGQQRQVQQRELQAGNAYRLQWSWYMVGGRPAHSDIRAKLMEIPALLSGRRDGAVIVLSAPCAVDGCTEAATAMRGFLESHGGILEAAASGK